MAGPFGGGPAGRWRVGGPGRAGGGAVPGPFGWGRAGRWRLSATGRAGAASVLVAAVLLDVGVDVLDGLVEDRLGVTAGEDVLGRLLEDRGDDRVGGRDGTHQGVVL